MALVVAHTALRASAAPACALTLVALLAAPAAAQEALWLAAPRERSAAWYETARAALEAEGVVVSEPDAMATFCTPALARSGARERAVAQGLCVSLRDGEVVIDLARVNGPAAQGTAPAGVDLARAVAEAYRRAELALSLGEDGLLRLRSRPEGALVTIDGEPAGHAPLERRLAPGSHSLELALEGFAGVQRSLEVERGRARELEVQLHKDASSARSEEPRTETSPLNYVVGGALLLAAVPALGFPIATLARDGECSQRDPSGGCSTVVHFGARSAVLLGAGVVAVLGGAYFLLLAPIEVEAAADPSSVRLGLRSRF